MAQSEQWQQIMLDSFMDYLRLHDHPSRWQPCLDEFALICNELMRPTEYSDSSEKNLKRRLDIYDAFLNMVDKLGQRGDKRIANTLAVTYMNRAYIRRGRDMTDEAIADYTAARNILAASGENRRLLAMCCVNMAFTHQKMNRLTSAVGEFGVAVEIFRALAAEDATRAADVYRLLVDRGTLMVKLRREDCAASDLTEAIEGFRSLGTDTLKDASLLAYLRALINRAGLYVRDRQCAEALKDCREAEAISERISSSEELSSDTESALMTNMAAALKAIGDFSGAVAAFDKALEIKAAHGELSVGEQLETATLRMGRGEAQERCCRYQAALDDYSYAIRCFSILSARLPDVARRRLITAYKKRGALYKKIGNEEFAEEDYKRAELLQNR